MMDLVKAEIERKRKQVDNLSIMVPEKKFFKRSEMYKQIEEIHKKKIISIEQKEEIVRKTGDSITQALENGILNRKEVIRRLRERNEPILLFGESESDAFKRLRKLEIIEPELNVGFRNDFQEAMEKLDQAYLSKILESEGDGKAKISAGDVSVPQSNITLEEIEDMCTTFGMGDHNHDQKLILSYLKFLSEVWGKSLNSRSEYEKSTVKGKLAKVTYTQTQSYLKPLFKNLKRRSLSADILSHLVKIVRFLLSKEYLQASDEYLQMAIGNAPWPIGGAFANIHPRSSSDKYSARQVAHVLNDETQRKYIQALKRLMTQCQKIFPSDPSKSIEYNA